MADLRMPNMNMIAIAGRLAFDSDLKYSPTGAPWAKNRIANTERTKDGEKTVWLDVKAFGKTAEMLGEQPKGAPILFQGRLALDEWEAKDGQKHKLLYVIADRVYPLAWPDDGAQSPQQPTAPAPTPAADAPIPDDDIPF